MRKLKLYLETTMFNYYFDEERDGHEDTVQLFEAIGAGEYDAYTSEYVTLELRRAEEPKRGNMLGLIEKYGITVMEYSDDTDRLAARYVSQNMIPGKYILDATHIAITSVKSCKGVLKK